MMPEKYRPILFPFAIGIIAALGIVSVLLLTRWGAGLFDWDSFNYLAAARSLANGKGLQIPIGRTALRPMVNFPPLFPAVLSIFELIRIDAMQGAKWLNAVLFGINLSLVASIVWAYTRSKGFAIATAILFLVSADLLKAHSWVLSEPLLICLILSGLLLFKAWKDSRRKVWLSLLFVVIGLAVLTKFVGAALAPAIALLFFMSDLPKRKKLTYATLSILAGLIPFVLWILRTFSLTATLNGYSLNYVPLQRGNLITAFFTFFTWFLPDAWLFGREKIALVLVSIILVGLVFYIVKYGQSGKTSFTPVAVFTVTFAVAYIAIVVTAKMLFDHGIGFQDRMFIPLFPLSLILFMLVAASIRVHFARKVAFLSMLIPIYLAAVFVRDSFVTLPSIYENGLGWNSRAIVTSPAILTLEKLALSSNSILYNNNIFGMYFRTGTVGATLNGFPPEVSQPETYLVIFKIHLNDEHALVGRYRENLDLLIEDDILSIHSYHSK